MDHHSTSQNVQNEALPRPNRVTGIREMSDRPERHVLPLPTVQFHLLQQQLQPESLYYGHGQCFVAVLHEFR